MLLADTTLAVEMVLQEGMIWFRRVFAREKLLVGGYGHGRCLHLFHDTFLGRDRESILELVLREVDLWDVLLALDLPNRLLNMLLCGTLSYKASTILYQPTHVPIYLVFHAPKKSSCA